MEDLISLLKSFIPAVVLASFGGFVSIVSGEKSLTVRYIIGGISISMLTGLVLHALIQEVGGSQNVWAITISIGGFCSREVMEMLKRKFMKKVESEIDNV